MKPKACTHRRWKITARKAFNDHTEGGEPHPDPRKRFRVLEVLRCVRCDAAGNRWSRFYGATARAALKRAGVPETDLPAPPAYKEKPPAEAPLATWPFPCSAHQEPA